MKAYTLAATTFRIISVMMILFDLYTLISTLFGRSRDGVHDFTPLNPLIFVISFIPGLIVYAAAPLLGRLAVWKIRE